MPVAEDNIRLSGTVEIAQGQGTMDAIKRKLEGSIETSGELLVLPEGSIRDLPPIPAGTAPEQIQERIERFFLSVAQIFEAWVARRSSHHTPRAYRQDVMAFITFM